MYNSNIRNSFILALGMHIIIISCALIYKIAPPIEIDSNQVELWDENSLQINEIKKISKLSNISKASNEDKPIKIIKPAQNIAETVPKIKTVPIIHNIKTNTDTINKIKDEKVDIAHNKKYINKKEEQISKQPSPLIPLINHKKTAENLPKTNIVEKNKKVQTDKSKKETVKQPIKNIKPVKNLVEKKLEQQKSKPILPAPKENIKNNAEEMRKANLARLMQNSNKEELPVSKAVNNSNNINQNKANSINTNNSNTINSSGLSSGYKSKIQSIIKRHIRYNGDSGITSVISLRIDARGNILFKNLVKSSGNSAWDNSALKAIEDAEPFPPPENAETTTMTLRITAD